jgi:hypothetical protein
MSRYFLRQPLEQDCAEVARLAGQLGYPAQDRVMQRRLQRLLASSNDLVFVAEATDGGLAG